MGGRASSEEFEDRYHGLSLANATKIFKQEVILSGFYMVLNTGGKY